MPVPVVTEAMDILPVAQAPPEEVLVKVIEAPAQTDEGPLIVPAAARGFTVIVAVAATVPQVLVTE